MSEVCLYVATWLNDVIGFCRAIKSGDLSCICAFAYMRGNVPGHGIMIDFPTFLGQFAWSVVTLWSLSLVIQVILVVIRRSTSLVAVGKSVGEYSPRSPSGFSDECEAFELVADALFSDCLQAMPGQMILCYLFFPCQSQLFL